MPQKSMLTIIIRNSVSDLHGNTKPLKIDTLNEDLIHRTIRYLISTVPINKILTSSIFVCCVTASETFIQPQFDEVGT